MQTTTKTYTRQDVRNLWRRYKYEGDRQAGNEFATIANARGQNYKTFQAEIDQECREEDLRLSYESRANTRATPEQRQQAGIELCEIAETYKRRRPDLSHQTAFKLALLDNPILAERYTGCPVKRNAQSEVARILDKRDSDFDPKSTKAQQLSYIVDRVPKFSDHSVDWTSVIREMFQYPNLVEAAAREVMDKLCPRWFRKSTAAVHHWKRLNGKQSAGCVPGTPICQKPWTTRTTSTSGRSGSSCRRTFRLSVFILDCRKWRWMNISPSSLEESSDMETVEIHCKAAVNLSLNDLTPLQGNLKELSESNFEKLRLSILRHGITFPFFVWQNESTNYILDGTQRDRVLRKMAKEGYEVPPLPCAIISAKDKREAAEKILLISSQYGKMTNHSLQEFLTENDLDFFELEEELEFPSIDLEFFRDPDFPPASVGEQGRLDQKNPVRCPECGHEWIP